MRVNAELENNKKAHSTLLLVDDNADSLYSVKQILKSDQRIILTATSGEEALRIAVNKNITLLLVDISMPNMDGFELVQILRHHPNYQKTPILFMTGASNYKSEHFMKLGFELGAIDYILKPIDSIWLQNKVYQLLKLIEAQRLAAELAASKEKQAFEKLAAELAASKEKQAFEKRVRQQQEDYNRVLQNKNQALERSNSALEQYAYVVSHDLKSPLRTIKTYSQLLLKQLGNKRTDDIDQSTRFIIESVDESYALLDGLLEYGRIGTTNYDTEVLDLNEALTPLIRRFQQEDQRSSEITVDTLPLIKGNIILINQVFNNLISNALKFNKNEKPQVHIGAYQLEGRTIFFVRDNGIGISDEYNDKIFRLFSRLHSADQYEGSGLGLAIVSKAVEVMQGTIWLEHCDLGAQFNFTLPSGQSAKDPCAVDPDGVVEA